MYERDLFVHTCTYIIGSNAPLLLQLWRVLGQMQSLLTTIPKWWQCDLVGWRSSSGKYREALYRWRDGVSINGEVLYRGRDGVRMHEEVFCRWSDGLSRCRDGESRCRCIWTQIHIEYLASRSTSEFAKKNFTDLNMGNIHTDWGRIFWISRCI